MVDDAHDWSSRSRGVRLQGASGAAKGAGWCASSRFVWSTASALSLSYRKRAQPNFYRNPSKQDVGCTVPGYCCSQCGGTGSVCPGGSSAFLPPSWPFLKHGSIPGGPARSEEKPYDFPDWQLWMTRSCEHPCEPPQCSSNSTARYGSPRGSQITITLALTHAFCPPRTAFSTRARQALRKTAKGASCRSRLGSTMRCPTLIAASFDGKSTQKTQSNAVPLHRVAIW